VLGSGTKFRTAQDIHDELRHRGARVGLTTVYRTLQTLAEAGDVDVLLNDEGEAIYRRCATDDHHHHLVCRHCGWSVEIASPDIEDWAVQSARMHGFTSVTHTAEIYGLCRRCSRR
jgi:Fur family transcriptional regulator, ferric uptake regulator